MGFWKESEMAKEAFLSPDQFEAVSKMKNGCILNGGTGSGKSRTGLYYYFKECGGSIDPDYKPMTRPRDLYIITTARKRDTLEWEQEMAPYLLSTHPDVCKYKINVVVDSWNCIKKYANVVGAFFIFDEDRVTGSGVWVKTFLKIAQRNRWIILSATPGDSYIEYVPVFVANGFYKNKSQFIAEHVVYSRWSKFPMIDKYINTQKLDRLRNDILVDMKFERSTIQIHEDVWCEYDRSTYHTLFKDRWNPFDEQPIENSSELCYLLRKVVNSDPSRVNALLDILKDHPRAIIFYSHNYELEILRSINYGSKVKVAEWNGQKHEPLPNTRNWVYLVQYAAGCEGWNCITTDTIIFFSQQYSYKVFNQACGRIDRRNTPFRDLYYYHLKSRATIDLSIARALKNKKDFNEKRWIG